MEQKIKRKLVKLSDLVSEGSLAPKVRQKDKIAADEMQTKAKTWFAHNTIQGLAVSTKITNNEDTKVPCLTIYVDKKRPLKKLKDPVPTKLTNILTQEDFPVDIVEIGQLELHNRFKQRTRPIFSGLSVGNGHRLPGTLGLVVKSNGSISSDLYILSCSHVLSPLSRRHSKTIYQPGRESSQTPSINDKVAQMRAAIPIRSSRDGFTNQFDAAIAKLDPNIVANFQIPYINHIKGVTGRVQKNNVVRIIGKESGFTTGKVINANFKTRLQYPTANGRSIRAGFQKLALCTGYGHPGDSGAIIINGRNKICGMHMAGSASHSIFCRMLPVLNYFNVFPVIEN